MKDEDVKTHLDPELLDQVLKQVPYQMTDDGQLLFLDTKEGFTVFKRLSKDETLDALVKYLPSKGE